MATYKGVNLGSSYRVAPGWLSLDHSKHVWIARIPGLARTLRVIGLLPEASWAHYANGTWRSVRFWDARARIPLPDASVPCAYSAHTLEHFFPALALQVAREVRRVLRDGGTFRVVLPDLEQVGAAYAALQAADRATFRGQTITREQWSDAAAEFCFAADSPARARFGHHWMYDKHGIRRLLLEAGFSAVHDRTFRVGETADLDVLDIIERKDESLYVEAVK